MWLPQFFGSGPSMGYVPPHGTWWARRWPFLAWASSCSHHAMPNRAFENGRPQRRLLAPFNAGVRPCQDQSWRWYNRCYTRAMKTAISIPDPVFKSAEQLAARLRVSRSELYSKAVRAFLDEHRDDLIPSRLNEVYGPGAESSSLDPDLASLQRRSI